MNSVAIIDFFYRFICKYLSFPVRHIGFITLKLHRIASHMQPVILRTRKKWTRLQLNRNFKFPTFYIGLYVSFHHIGFITLKVHIIASHMQPVILRTCKKWTLLQLNRNFKISTFFIGLYVNFCHSAILDLLIWKITELHYMLYQ